MKARALPRARVYAAWASGPLAVVLGAGAHFLGGGGLPGIWILLALGALLSMGASIVARFRLPFWTLMLSAGLIQHLLHVMFTELSGNATGTSSGHAHDTASWTPPELAPATGGHQAVELMLDGHAAAALLTVFIISQAGALVARTLRRRKSVRSVSPDAA